MADQEKAQMQDLAKEIQRSIAGGVFDIDFGHLTPRRQETVRLATRQILRVLALGASAPVCPDCGEVMRKECQEGAVDLGMPFTGEASIVWRCGCKPEADQAVSEEEPTDAEASE